jgi:thiol-disulfide isomerase/thioredoxin
MQNLLILTILFLVISSCKNTYNEIEVPEEITSIYDVRTVNYYNTPKELKIGDMAPNFIMNPDSKFKVELKELRNNTVLIYFGASWCIHCRQFEPKLENIYHNNKNYDLEIIKVLNDYEKDEFINKLTPDKEIYNIFNQKEFKNLNAIYPIDYYPFYYLIDKFGVIRAMGNPNSQSLNNNLEMLLIE